MKTICRLEYTKETHPNPDSQAGRISALELGAEKSDYMLDK